MAASLRRVRDDIAVKTAALPKDKLPRTLMIVSMDPLFVAGPGSFQNDMLTACGAKNVAGGNVPFAPMSLEAVVAADPQVLIMTNDENGHKVSLQEQLKKLKASPAWSCTSAVKSGRVYVVEVAHVSVPGPRLALGLRSVARDIHPEIFGR